MNKATQNISNAKSPEQLTKIINFLFNDEVITNKEKDILLSIIPNKIEELNLSVKNILISVLRNVLTDNK